MELIMQTLILFSLLLALLHIWLLPIILNAKNMEYLLSNRDGAVEESAMSGRVRRASTNFKESFPVFLALCLLSIIVEVDNTSLAMYWLIFRALYLISYAAGIIYLRTVLWFSSLVCLIMMAVSFV
tara:strand:- start:4 stop:381 length:378 start_codon:yes stop_codon:yes gene_type:complete